MTRKKVMSWLDTATGLAVAATLTAAAYTPERVTWLYLFFAGITLGSRVLIIVDYRRKCAEQAERIFALECDNAALRFMTTRDTPADLLGGGEEA